MKRKLMWVMLAMHLGLLSGCASVSRPAPITVERCWSDPEQSVERTRFYPEVEERQALQAATQLLRLAGKDDMKIQPFEHHISAEFHRQTMIYLFLVAHRSEVWDHWIVATRPAPDGVWICVHVLGQYFSDTFVLGAEPVTNAVYPAATTERDPGQGFKPRARAYPVDFDTFWARLDYLLGLNPVWAPCPAGGGIRKSEARKQSEINPLCHALADDPPPHGH
jgi:hypothetical protein